MCQIYYDDDFQGHDKNHQTLECLATQIKDHLRET